MEEKMVLSALPSYPGYKVIQDLGLVYSFDTEFHMMRNLWSLGESFERAQEQLSKKAQKLGADAVLGISMSMGPEQSIPILMGTAVKLEKE